MQPCSGISRMCHHAFPAAGRVLGPGVGLPPWPLPWPRTGSAQLLLSMKKTTLLPYQYTKGVAAIRPSHYSFLITEEAQVGKRRDTGPR